MNRFRQIFPAGHIVLPVIHASSMRQAMQNARIAHDAGADGIFLINHGMHWPQLLEIHSAVSDSVPDWWIGVNCLGLGPEDAIRKVSKRVAGVWTDNALIEESDAAQPRADAVAKAIQETGWQGLYFGGVAFKYQRPVADLAAAAKRACRYMDVVTTSGPGTGHAADVAKIKAMKVALGDYPLAIASGITPENVEECLPYSDCYLVATGISRSFDQLDPDRVKALVNEVRAYDRLCDKTIATAELLEGLKGEFNKNHVPEMELRKIIAALNEEPVWYGPDLNEERGTGLGLTICQSCHRLYEITPRRDCFKVNDAGRFCYPCSYTRK